MSIKGNFSDITFAELLKLISKYNGRLGIWNFQEKKQYECFLQNENVIYVNINGQNVIEPEIINRFFSELSRDNQSYYSFQKDAVLDFIPKLNLSVSKVLSFVVSLNTIDIESKQNLPNNLTKFEIVKDFKGHLPTQLESFWNLSVTHFHLGCSASELADIFGMPLGDVQLNIYKLRTIGVIKPVRLFKINNVSAKAKSASANLQKLVNMRKGVRPAPLTTNNFPPTVSNYQDTNTNSFSNNIKSEPLVNQNSHLENKSFDNFELDKVIHIQNNDHFLNKYVPTATPPIFMGNETIDESKEIERKVEEQNNVALPNKKPIFDLNTVTAKQSIVKRMLSSLFSRKAH